MVNQPLRNFCAVLAVLSLIFPVFAQQAQKPRPSQPKAKAATPQKKLVSAKPTPEPTPKHDPAKEKERFDAALGAGSAAEKAELLVKFIAEFPKSELKTRAEESLAGARAAMADERLTAGDLTGAVKLFKLVVETAPKPYSDRLFTGIIGTIPANLYLRGFKAEAIELARLVEANISTNAKQLVLLSTFYLGTENGDAAERLAEAAVAIDEKNAAAHQALAAAQRLNFDLESAETSFAKAVELDPESTIAKQSLADIKRGIGKAEEAETIYREILEGNDKNNQARTGLTLSLFDQGKRAAAEEELDKTLAEVPGNVVVMSAAAYWYAANKDGDKAVYYAQRAIDKAPGYIWSHIALARGLMVQGKPVDAERVLLAARKYGNFPTLQYEIASARFAAGFFREAVEELRTSFSVVEGSVRTKLGGRIDSSADSFGEAIAMERRASIFAPRAAESPEAAERLKALVELSDRLTAEKKGEEALVAAAERFAEGTDNMSVHRKLYAANLLLQNGVANSEALKLAGDAVEGLDRSLDVPNAGAAVMANELYEARNVSFARDDFLLIPEVPRQTLISLMRGKVEETTGLALLQQGKPEEATIRFKRALSVLPADSAWWRSATWNLGTSLAAEGKEKEALERMISSYAIDKPNLARYVTIEALWIKVNGGREGLEEKIGPNPMPNFSSVAKTEASPSPSPAEASPAQVEKSEPETKEETSPSPSVSPTPEITPSPTTAETEARPTPTPVSASTEATPEVTPTPEIIPSPRVAEIFATPIPENLVAAVNPDRSPGTETQQTPKPSPSPSAEDSKMETLPTPSEATVAKAGESGNKPEARRTSGSIFDPIVISIPNSKTANKAKPAEEAPVTNSQRSETPPPVAEQKQIDESAGQGRPRIVEGKAVVGELMPCQISVSQENVSLIRNGGSLALIVSIEEGEDIKLLAARSNSPADVEVRLEPPLVEIPGRSMFVIKSTSDNVGLYQVVFAAPCGRKDITVRVR